MPEAAFVVTLDDYQGFIVAKRYPSSLSLTEKILNLVFFELQQGEKEDIKYSDVEGMKIASFSQSTHPRTFVNFVLGPEEELEMVREQLAGMGRRIVELMDEGPEAVDLEQTLTKGVTLDKPSEEQLCAQIYLTPSSALLLEKLQAEGVEKAVKLSMWLKSQVQTDVVDLREVIAPLMQAGVATVEMIGKTSETVFLIRDIFGYRSPPVVPIMCSSELQPELYEKYKEMVAGFFAPESGKGYNPTLPFDDPNSPILEDRERIAKVLTKNLNYAVLKALRKQPMALEEIARKTVLPDEVVQNALWSLEAQRVVHKFEDSGLWALITNPQIELFLPEYVLPIIKRKLAEKELNEETAARYLELLLETWSEQDD
jgi:hypothetical protein